VCGSAFAEVCTLFAVGVPEPQIGRAHRNDQWPVSQAKQPENRLGRPACKKAPAEAAALQCHAGELVVVQPVRQLIPVCVERPNIDAVPPLISHAENEPGVFAAEREGPTAHIDMSPPADDEQ